MVRFLTKKTPSINTIVVLHVVFSIGFMLMWTFLKRGGDFSVMFCPNEKGFVAGNVSRLGWTALVTGVLFKYLHFNHLAFYLFNTFLSTISVVIFHSLARTCLDKKLSLYATAIFAFNPAVFYYNNFVLKETILMLIIVSVMYLFLKAIETNLLWHKIVLLLLLPLLLTREPFCFMFLLLFAFLPKRKMKIMILLPAVVLLFSVICYANCQDWNFISIYLHSHLGNYGATKIILRHIYGKPTVITYAELLTTPVLFAKYILLSVYYFFKPGLNDGIKLNCVLIPYDLFFYFILIASFKFRKLLCQRDKIAYSYIGIIFLLVSLVFLIYDPLERYRDSITPLLTMLLVLNFKGWQNMNCLQNASGFIEITANLIAPTDQKNRITSQSS